MHDINPNFFFFTHQIPSLLFSELEHHSQGQNFGMVAQFLLTSDG